MNHPTQSLKKQGEESAKSEDEKVFLEWVREREKKHEYKKSGFLLVLLKIALLTFIKKSFSPREEYKNGRGIAKWFFFFFRLLSYSFPPSRCSFFTHRVESPSPRFITEFLFLLLASVFSFLKWQCEKGKRRCEVRRGIEWMLLRQWNLLRS